MTEPVADSAEIDSPCLRVCKYNDEQHCFGCFRTNVEVRTWNTMTTPERAAVVASLDDRRSRYWDRFTADQDAPTSRR
jgi:predicted Fe-S protein YdhL (DUF1289 family)